MHHDLWSIPVDLSRMLGALLTIRYPLSAIRFPEAMAQARAAMS